MEHKLHVVTLIQAVKALLVCEIRLPLAASDRPSCIHSSIAANHRYAALSALRPFGGSLPKTSYCLGHFRHLSTLHSCQTASQLSMCACVSEWTSQVSVGLGVQPAGHNCKGMKHWQHGSSQDLLEDLVPFAEGFWEPPCLRECTRGLNGQVGPADSRPPRAGSCEAAASRDRRDPHHIQLLIPGIRAYASHLIAF